MASRLSKEERKALAKKVMAERAKHPQAKTQSGFAKLDEDAKKLR